PDSSLSGICGNSGGRNSWITDSTSAVTRAVQNSNPTLRGSHRSAIPMPDPSSIVERTSTPYRPLSRSWPAVSAWRTPARRLQGPDDWADDGVVTVPKLRVANRTSDEWRLRMDDSSLS